MQRRAGEAPQGTPAPRPHAPWPTSRSGQYACFGSSIPSTLITRVPRLRLVQPWSSAGRHGCKLRSRGTRRFNFDGILADGRARDASPRGAGGLMPALVRFPVPRSLVPNSRCCFFATSYPQRLMPNSPCHIPSNSGQNRSKRGQNRVKKASKTRAFRHAHLNIWGGHTLWR